jgi:hypothetical protein
MLDIFNTFHMILNYNIYFIMPYKLKLSLPMLEIINIYNIIEGFPL